MLTTLLIGLAIVLIVFLIVVALQSATFRVERSVSIAAPAAEIFPHLNNLRKAQVWSPWVKIDPNATYSFDGPPEGVGASNGWAGNQQVGEGRQTIIESNPNEVVRIRLDFKKPMAATHTAEFLLQPVAGQTRVTWAIFGENNLFAKAFCLFMNQDKMIGVHFESGLASLKSLVESARRPQAIASQ